VTAPRFTPPPGAAAYRRIGPFGPADLPAALLREHRLKPGVWGQVEVLAGSIGFAWDDPAGRGETVTLRAGEMIHVPPTIPHHLEPLDEDFRLEIAFLSEA
jgi:tellurite resistance-related uncharacterized protein